MKKKYFFAILTALVALLLVGCNDPAPVATIEPEGEEVILTEQIITEKVLTEDIITWDVVPTQTWD